jgi:hypothetical protein
MKKTVTILGEVIAPLPYGQTLDNTPCNFYGHLSKADEYFTLWQTIIAKVFHFVEKINVIH